MQFIHSYVVDGLSQQIPTLIVRYEDLVTDPEPRLVDCFKFLLEVQSIEGTVVEQRIKQVVESG